MRDLYKYTAITTFFIVLLTSCHTASDVESALPITPGTYEFAAQRIEVGGTQLPASKVGGYFYRTFRFFRGDSLHITIKSDIAGENGLAKGKYLFNKSSLTITVEHSNTTYYTAGDKIIYQSFKEVNENYADTLSDDSTSDVFQGPGLILTSESEDRNDLDQDNDTTETVSKTEFYKFRLRYD